MKQTLIENTTIVSMNENRDVYENGSILIENSCIKAIGKIAEELIDKDCERIDGKDKIILPGLINTHVHLNQQLGRGLADDVDLLTWLRDRIWPYESTLNYEDAYISALACLYGINKIRRYHLYGSRWPRSWNNGKSGGRNRNPRNPLSIHNGFR